MTVDGVTLPCGGSRRPPGPGLKRGRPRKVVDCPEYSDAEIGAMVRLALDGMSIADIAGELDMEPKEVWAMLKRASELRAHKPANKDKHGARGSRSIGRPCSLNPDEREKACRWKGEGLSVPVIARRLKCSQGVVRWVTEKVGAEDAQKTGEGV